jgi:hypothetical protein
MLTVFSTPKPFIGHSNVIQRNALKSWTLLHPNSEVILFGDEEGAAETCRDLGIRHEPHVRRNEHGTKYLNHLFDQARDMSRNEFLCYANCDIMLTSDFIEALKLVSKAHSQFLMIGRRWDTEITEPLDFGQPDWSDRLRSFALLKGKQNGPSWVDYFCFSRDLYYRKMPPFLIGRHGWDPWLTWHARQSKARLIDASRMVVPIHQNHDYAYLGEGPAAERSKAEATYNWGLGGTTAWHYYGVEAATERLSEGMLLANRLAWLGPVKGQMTYYFYRAWWTCLRATRPIRHRLGLGRGILKS